MNSPDARGQVVPDRHPCRGRAAARRRAGRSAAPALAGSAVVACAEDGVAALNAIEAHAPDLAFLDIHMPLLNGLEVATRIAGRCHVVFITSYDQHAVEAFEAGAIDYVLKPPTAARMLTTVQRLKARLHQPAPDLRDRLDGLAQQPQRPGATCSGSTPRAAPRCDCSPSTRSSTSSPISGTRWW